MLRLLCTAFGGDTASVAFLTGDSIQVRGCGVLSCGACPERWGFCGWSFLEHTHTLLVVEDLREVSGFPGVARLCLSGNVCVEFVAFFVRGLQFGQWPASRTPCWLLSGVLALTAGRGYWLWRGGRQAVWGEAGTGELHYSTLCHPTMPPPPTHTAPTSPHMHTNAYPGFPLQ